MKHAKGFLTNDGQFFENEEEAELHEAEMNVRGVMAIIEVDSDKLLEILRIYPDQIGRYINAYRAVAKRIKYEPKQEVDPTVERTSNDEGPEEQLAPIL